MILVMTAMSLIAKNETLFEKNSSHIVKMAQA